MELYFAWLALSKYYHQRRYALTTKPQCWLDIRITKEINCRFGRKRKKKKFMCKKDNCPMSALIILLSC